MNTLNHYTDKLTTELFNNAGAFFAFGQKQFDEKKQDGITYVSMGAGLICPKDKAKEVLEGVDNITADGIKARLEEYGVEKIIQYELANHESHFSFDHVTVRAILSDYGVTDEMFDEGLKIYMDYCNENDLF